MAQDIDHTESVVTPKNQLKTWWVTGAKPSQAQYYLWMDAYWHKSDAIPPSKINGLSQILADKADAYQLQHYAKTTAENINVEAWKVKLGVGSLPANVATIDYVDANGSFYIGNAYKKVVKPNDGNIYVLNIDGSAVNANTFGKNITNSSNTTNGSHTQTQRSGDTAIWETNGQPYLIKSLPDKSADASFVDFVGKNNQGQLSKVGFPALNNLVSGLTAQQALTISQLLNGSTGGGGEISVNLVSPPIIQNQYDSVEYVLLKGVNLNLNPTAMSVQILAADKSTVMAIIPNNQIQLSAGGLELVFYYNFHQFDIGTYYLKITSGVKTYITTLGLKIVEQIQNINLSSITWEVNKDVTVNNTQFSTTEVISGGNLTLEAPTGEDSLLLPLSLKSSQIFDEGEDFYVELKIDMSLRKLVTGSYPEIFRLVVNNNDFFGLGYSDTVNNSSINSLINASFKWDYGINRMWNNSQIQLQYSSSQAQSITLIFIKTGNLFRTILSNTNVSKTISNNMGYSLFLQLGNKTYISSNNTRVTQPYQIQIVKAFKFN